VGVWLVFEIAVKLSIMARLIRLFGILDLKLSPCCSVDKSSFGYSPGVLLLLKTDVSERPIGSIFSS